MALGGERTSHQAINEKETQRGDPNSGARSREHQGSRAALYTRFLTLCLAKRYRHHLKEYQEW